MPIPSVPSSFPIAASVNAQAGSGTPEGVVTASVGSLWLQTDSGTIWRKGSGTGNTGWLRTDLGVFNIKDYGAVGNGIANDTAAIVAALAAAPNGSTVFAPSGMYNHTAIVWNKPVSLIGEPGTEFIYTPATGIAWSVTGITEAMANAGDITNYEFRNLHLTGPGGTVTVGMKPNTFWFSMNCVRIEEFGIGMTWDTGAPQNTGFLSFHDCLIVSCNQLLWVPNLVIENVTFEKCTLQNATTFADGILFESTSGADFYFQNCSINNTQFNVKQFGMKVDCNGCHWEINGVNPTVPMIKQLDGELKIIGGFMLIPSTATTIPRAIQANNTAGDAFFYCTGLRAFSGIAVPFLTLASSISTYVRAVVQGFATPAITGSTTGSTNVNVVVYGDVIQPTVISTIADGSVALVSGTTPAINVSKGNYFTLSILTNIAVVIAVPTGRPFQGGQEITIAMRNASGGALTTPPTFNTGANGFKFSTVTNPGNGTQVLYKFRWDSVQSFWYEIGTHLAAGI